jgi:DNA-binding NarL/FixJ family response regulator
MTGSIRVALVEDNAGLRASLVKVLGQGGDITVVAAYPSAEAALAGLPQTGVDVVLMDIHLPGMSGVDCVRRLKELLPSANVIMLTVYDDSDLIFEALKAGASGYLLKRAAAGGIVDAIREVHAGGAPMSSHIARKVVASFRAGPPASPPDTKLRPREEEVLVRVARGLVNKEIADDLGISTETVRQHLKNIYAKLHVHSRTEAAMKVFGRIERRSKSD